MLGVIEKKCMRCGTTILVNDAQATKIRMTAAPVYCKIHWVSLVMKSRKGSNIGFGGTPPTHAKKGE